jgi:Flp pilus assembly protein TadD
MLGMGRSQTCKGCGIPLMPGDGFCGACGRTAEPVANRRRGPSRSRLFAAVMITVLVAGAAWFFWLRSAPDVRQSEDINPRRAVIPSEPTPAAPSLAPRYFPMDARDAGSPVAPPIESGQLPATLSAPATSPFVSGDAAFARGTDLLRAQDFAGALREFRFAVQAEPNRAERYNALGKALGALGRYAEAEKEFREAVRLGPDSWDHHLGLAEALAWQGKWADAELPYIACIRLHPDLARAHIGLGAVLFKKNDFAGAEPEYREAVRLEPKNAQGHVELAGALHRLGRIAEATEEARRGIRLGFADNHWVLTALRLRQPAPR